MILKHNFKEKFIWWIKEPHLSLHHLVIHCSHSFHPCLACPLHLLNPPHCLPHPHHPPLLHPHNLSGEVKENINLYLFLKLIIFWCVLHQKLVFQWASGCCLFQQCFATGKYKIQLHLQVTTHTHTKQTLIYYYLCCGQCMSKTISLIWTRKCRLLENYSNTIILQPFY